jgi:phosphoglycolate phosphatase-like HAD superfamily hydrolase
VDNKLWKQKYSEIPKFPCPRCGEGRARQKSKEQFLIWEPNWATNELDEADLRSEVSVGKFAGLLRCEETSCDEAVAICGEYVANYEQVYNSYQEAFDVNTKYEYSIAGLNPMPRIIKIPDGLSDDCVEQIDAACNLFFVDLGACANKLRVATERLLDHLQVPQRRSLAERIDEFEKIQPGHKAIFDALRHVGNVASHEGKSDFDYVIDCFRLLEFALEELVENRSASIAAAASKIVATKGKPVP